MPKPEFVTVAAKTIASCEGEQYMFEEWAKSKGYDMDEHPLHYLFMDRRTAAARDAWKAALEYVRSASVPEGSLLRPATLATSPDMTTPEGRAKAAENARHYRETLKPFA